MKVLLVLLLGAVDARVSYEVTQMDLVGQFRSAAAVGEVRIDLPQNSRLRLGLGHGDIDVKGSGIWGTTDLFWRAGVETELWASGPWSIGLAGQVEQWTAKDSAGLAGRRFGTDLSLFRWQVRPCMTWGRDGLSFYGGPSVTWTDGRVIAGWLPLTHRVARWSLDRMAYGVFGGVSCALNSHLSLNLEAEASEIGKGLSLGCSYGF